MAAFGVPAHIRARSGKSAGRESKEDWNGVKMDVKKDGMREYAEWDA